MALCNPVHTQLLPPFVGGRGSLDKGPLGGGGEVGLLTKDLVR